MEGLVFPVSELWLVIVFEEWWRMRIDSVSREKHAAASFGLISIFDFDYFFFVTTGFAAILNLFVIRKSFNDHVRQIPDSSSVCRAL